MGVKEWTVKKIRGLPFCKDLFLALWGFLLARVSPLAGLQFFGLSFLMALFFQYHYLKPLPFLMILLGYLSTGYRYYHVFLPVMAFLLLNLLLGSHLKGTFFFVHLLSLGGLFLCSYMKEGSLVKSLFPFVEILLYFFFLYLFKKALEGFELFQQEKDLDNLQLLSLFFLFSIPLLLLQGLLIKGVSIFNLLLLTLFFAFTGKGGIGISTIIATAIVPFHVPLSSSLQALFYPLLGFLGGLFQDLKSIGLGLAFLLSFLLMEVLFSSPFTIYEGLICLILFSFMDGFSLPNSLKKKSEGGEKLKERHSHQLWELGDVFFCFNQGSTPIKEDDPEVFLQQLSQEVCSPCQYSSLCKSDVLPHQNLLLPLVLKGNPVPKVLIEETLKYCPYPQEIRLFMEKFSKDNHYCRRKEENFINELLWILVKGIGEGLGTDPTYQRGRKVSWGIACLYGEEVSGDSHLILELSGGRYLIGLSDGLGRGRSASQKSSQVLELLSKLLGVGIGTRDALHILNLLCLLTYCDEEYTTLDLALFSPSFSQVTFYKYGAASTFIKRGLLISSICSPSLPLGVTSKKGKAITRKLKGGDQVILVTDGVLEVSQEAIIKEEWLLHFLKDVSLRDPQQLAEIILQEAKDRIGSSFLDDMTVMVINC